MRRFLLAAGACVLVLAASGVALAQAEISDEVILAWGEAESADFAKMLQRFSFGAYDIENPQYREAEDGSTTAVIIQYKRDQPEDPRWEWVVTVSRACDGCNTKVVKETALLATEWDTRAHHWEGHPEFCTQRQGGYLEADATYWPCVEEHRLAGGLIGVEVYGHTLADRNQGYSVSTYTVVAGDYTVVVDAQVLKYGDYTAEFLAEFRTATSTLVDLYAAHLLSISGGGGGGSSGGDTGSTGGPAAPIGYIVPVTAIGAIAAIAAALATAVGSGAAGGLGAATTTVTPPLLPPVTGTFVDPDTGQALPVDGGDVWFGEWMPPDQAQKLIDQRIDEINLDKQAAAQHQQFVSQQQGIREEELKDIGFTFDADTNKWVPGENTQAILDKQWLDKIAQDPTWQETQKQFAAIQWELDVAKTSTLQSHNWFLQKEHDLAIELDKAYARWEWGAKGVQVVADTSINILEKVTGPAGGTIKKGYTFLKTFSGELATDGVSGQTLLTATLKGLSDVGMDEAGGKILPGYDFGDGPDLSGYDVKKVASHLFGKDSKIRYYMMRHFAPGVFNAGQGEVQNYLGWRPMGDDAKKLMGALSGNKQDAESLVKDPTFLEWLAKRHAASLPKTVIGGAP
ncbi:MAG: hypothetical protein KJN71_09725 [Acidimicrobiia bacterium]|nr:hypothetical protein [Acidimicrobiia bacterium]